MRRLHAVPVLLVALHLALVLPGGAAADDDGGWPFGASRGFGQRGGDHYNLGLLGAKAKDPEAVAAAPQGMGGRRGGRAARPRHHNGPDRLEIVLLFPGGPAETAGLEVGDVIVGEGRSEFDEGEGSLAELAEALVDAEGGRGGGVLDLLVERHGETEKVEVEIPQGGRDARDPLDAEGRKPIVEKALAWLAERQQDSGGFRQTLSGTNGAVVMTSLAGLCWLAGGSDTEGGPYAEHVARAVDFVVDNLGVTGGGGLAGRGGSNWDQTNWGVAHAAIFLGELHARDPGRKVKAALHRCGQELVKRQEDSGGWAHGPGGPNALGYVELNIVSGLALAGLGMAHQAGFEVPEATLEKAEAYLEASSAGGGVGYSADPGQAGQGNIGRTAMCWLGYQALGRGRSDLGRQMKKWTARHVDEVFGGHASLMEHILHAGVAAHALGRGAERDFWEVAERDMVLARAPDGSFQPRPWHESLGIGSNSDVTFGEVWTTAAWTIVLACQPDEDAGFAGLPAWTGLDP